MRALIPLVDGCEEIETATMIDVLRRAGVEVITAALGPGDEVAGGQRLQLRADALLDEVGDDDYDLVALPGGPGAGKLSTPRVHAILQRQLDAGKLVGAICAAPLALAEAGLLEGRTATAYPGVLDARSDCASTGKPVERDGNIITGRGPGDALQFALALVAALKGQAARAQLEKDLLVAA